MLSWLRIAFPQAITLSGIFCGMLAIMWAPMRPYWACVAIILAALCDTVDGRVARVLKTQSTFGAQLDSLADIVSFGLAPVYLVYYWVFAPQEFVVFDLSWIFLFFFVACGALRLARFNTTTNAAGEVQKEFEGIPIPVGALLPTTLVMTRYELDLLWLQDRRIAAALLLVSGFLMISRIRFPSYKHFRNRKRQIFYYGLIIFGLSVLCSGGPGGTLLLSFIIGYVLYGIASGFRREQEILPST